MFTEDHYKILKALTPDGSTPQTIADETGLPVSVASHLLEELDSYGFVKILKELNSSADLEIVFASLQTKGDAAIASPDRFINKPMNPQTVGNTSYIFSGPVGVVASDHVQVPHFTQNNNTQNLAEVAQEIQILIDRLSQSYPTTTMPEKVGFASAIVQQIDTNPSLSTRVLSASKAGGTAAIGQFLNHPLSSFIIAAIEDWQKTKQP
jgi:hypothetical protein